MKILAIPLLLLQLQDVIGSITEEKCKEYAELTRKERFGANDWLSSFSRPGKLPTTPGEFPHMVQLGYGNGENKVWACGGTIISDQYILTSATCETLNFLKLFYTRKRRYLFLQELINKPIPTFPLMDTKVEWVKLGDKTNGLQEIKVKEIILHPGRNDKILFNDIALLKLNEKIKFGKYIRPACLYTGTDNLVNETVRATGWGQQRFGEYFSDDLMKVELQVYSEEECKQEYSVYDETLLGKVVTEATLCAGGYEEKKTLCLGDGGEPFQIKNANYSDIYDIVGVVSFGYTCNYPNFPSLATRVSSYIPRIESVVWPTID